MKKNRRKILSGSRKIFFAILAMFLSLSASAQQITASGQVLDAQKEPLIGVSVQEKGTSNGAITDLDGNFTLNVKQNAILIFSYVGYKSQEVKAAQQMKITLQEDNEVLDEVVVIGYGSVKRKDVTTAISSVSTKDLDMRPIVSAGQAIQGKAAGVSVIQPNGTPGGEMSIRVRGTTSMNGSNDPLYVVDGVPVDNIKFLSPNDIESMQILKDASSASIYGSRAANGVVVITTVTPKPGEVRVSYNFTGTVEMPDLSDYNLANASEKLEMERLAGLFDNSNMENQILDYNKRFAQIQRGVDTDWMVLPLRNAFDHKHSLFIEGGTQNLRWGVDASYNAANGVMKGSGRDRYSVGFSLDYRMKSLQVKNTVSFTHSKSKESPYGSFSDYTILQPYDTPYNDDGTLRKRLSFSKNSNLREANNPLYEATLGNYTWSAYDEVSNNLSLNWYLTDYWTVRGQFSVNRKYSSGERFIDPLSSKTTAAPNEGGHNLGDLYVDDGNSLNWNANAALYYTRSFNKHNLNLSVAWEASSGSSDATNVHYRGFPSGQFHSSNYAAEIYEKPSRTEGTSRMVSAWATGNYTWNDIYLADFSVRFDGSSDFGSKQRWAPFFSGGLGVNIHNYEFLKGNEMVNKLKVRASYGRTGKASFPAYAATTMYEALFDEWYATGFGAVLKALGNNNLTWEKTDKFNVGIEMQFLNRRLTVDADYYHDKTIDLVNDVSLSQTSGFSSYKDNMGEVLNQGFELQVRGEVFRNRDWLVALWGNMAHNKNKILKISDSQRAYNHRVKEFYENIVNEEYGRYNSKYGVPISQYEEGQSLTSIWAVKSLGIDPTTGKEIFLNRDGSVSDTWNATQEVAVGNTEPKFNGSIGFNAAYKQWSLFAAFQYEWGGQEYNQTLVDRVENARIQYQNVDLRVLTDRWKQPGDIAQFKDIKNADSATMPTSRFVQDKAYLRLSALTLSYDFNREWIKKYLGMNMLRLEASTRDFINWNSIRQERGLSYPKSWTVDFSIKAQF